MRELWGLDYALLEVVVRFRSSGQTIQIYSLSATAVECAEKCRQCIASFRELMIKFGKILQSRGLGSKIGDVVCKVQWQILEREELAKFRVEMLLHQHTTDKDRRLRFCQPCYCCLRFIS